MHLKLIFSLKAVAYGANIADLLITVVSSFQQF